MAEPRIDENGLPVYAPGDYDYVRVVDRSTGASRNALAPEVTAAARAISEALDGLVADARENINEIIRDLGYLAPVPYSLGLSVNDIKFTVSYNGDVYAPKPELVPFTTGTWDPDQWNVIQGDINLRSDLADPTGGSGLVSFKQSGPTTYARTVAAELLDRVSILRFIPPALHAGIRAGTNTTDLSAYVQNAVNHCIQNGRELYCPAGVYEISGVGRGYAVLMSNLTANGQGLVMRGEGRGKTIFRESAGATVSGGRFTKMFYYALETTSFNPGSFVFQGITFDKNGRSNGVPPSLYDWEQAHIFSWAGTPGTTEIGSITFREVDFKDKIGACINMSTAACKIGSIIIDDVQSPGENHPNTILNGGHYGDRGDLEFGMDSEAISIVNTVAQYSQIEPVVASSATRRRHARVANSKIDNLEFTDRGGYSFIDVNSCECTRKLYVSGMNANIVATTFKVETSQSYGGGTIRVLGCTVLLPYNAETGVVTGFAHGPNAGNTGYFELFVSDSSFVIDAVDTPVAPNGRAISGGTGSEMGSRLRIIDNCIFDPRLSHSIDCYRNGDWIVRNCVLAGSVIAVEVGGIGANGGRVVLSDNDFSRVTGFWVRVIRSNELWELHFKGSYQANPSTFTSSGTSPLDGRIKSFPAFEGAAAPTGWWPRGCFVRNGLPSAGGNVGWVKVVSDGLAGNWKSYGEISA